VRFFVAFGAFWQVAMPFLMTLAACHVAVCAGRGHFFGRLFMTLVTQWLQGVKAEAGYRSVGVAVAGQACRHGRGFTVRVVVATAACWNALLPGELLGKIVKRFMAVTAHHLMGSTQITQVGEDLFVATGTLQRGHGRDGLGKHIVLGHGCTSTTQCGGQKEQGGKKGCSYRHGGPHWLPD